MPDDNKQPFYLNPAFKPYIVTYPQGATVVRQGDDERTLSILLKGTLKVTRDGHVLSTVSEPGAFIGEMSLILGEPRSATVVAVEDVELISLAPSKLQAVITAIPELSVMLMRTLARRLEQTSARLTEMEDRYDHLFNATESLIIEKNDDAGITLPLTPPPAAEPERHGEKSPLWERQVKCPAHDGEEVFSIHLLRRNSLRYEKNEFDLINYTAPNEGFASLDYTLFEAHVCPVCHFACNDADVFLNPDDGSSQNIFIIRRAIRRDLDALREARGMVAQELATPDRFMARDRTPREGLLAFRLARMTAEAFYMRDSVAYSSWIFRTIICHLKEAHICRHYGVGEEESASLRRAQRLVREYQKRFTGTQYFHALYLDVVLTHALATEDAAQRQLRKFVEELDRLAPRLEPRLKMQAEDYMLKAQRLLGVL